MSVTRLAVAISAAIRAEEIVKYGSGGGIILWTWNRGQWCAETKVLCQCFFISQKPRFKGMHGNKPENMRICQSLLQAAEFRLAIRPVCIEAEENVRCTFAALEIRVVARAAYQILFAFRDKRGTVPDPKLLEQYGDGALFRFSFDDGSNQHDASSMLPIRS